MAFITANTSARQGLLRRIGTGILDILWTVFTAGPGIAQVERLTRLSDDDLAARGTSRAAEIERIFGPRAHF
jgi:hypothetical protein